MRIIWKQKLLWIAFTLTEIVDARHFKNDYDHRFLFSTFL